MSNDKMRDEFSAWYLAEVTESYGEGCRAQAEKNLAWVFEDGRFADPMLRLACLAWAASREALVIQLPEKCEYADFQSEYAKGHRQGMRAYRDAIEAAGVKCEVKP